MKKKIQKTNKWFLKIEILIILILSIAISYSCTNKTSSQKSKSSSSESNSDINSDDLISQFVFSNVYDCDNMVTGFDTCPTNSNFKIQLDTNGTIGIMSVWKTVSGETKHFLYVVDENFNEDFPLINSTTEQFVLMDKTLNKAIFYSKVAQITGFFSYDINFTEKKVTANSIIIPTSTIDNSYGFRPFYLNNDILYGVAKRTSDSKILVYSVDFSDKSSIVLTALGGLDDGGADLNITLDEDYPIDQIKLIDNIVYYHPANSTDLNSDGNRDDSRIYWVDKTDTSKHGVSSGTSMVAAGVMTVFGKSLYYRYILESPTKAQWMKIDNTGKTSVPFPLSIESPLFLLDFKNKLYGIMDKEYYGTNSIISVYSKLYEIDTISNVLDSKEYSVSGLSINNGVKSAIGYLAPRKLGENYYLTMWDNNDNANNLIEKLTKEN